ncbi:Glycoside hydrolase, partial [Phytophthora palmivora]
MFDAKTGDAFAVKGIDYYPRPNTGDLDENNHDFFTDDNEAIWRPDIEYLAQSGANAVRLYAVDPSKSHDLFMCALRAKGMYALVDLALYAAFAVTDIQGYTNPIVIKNYKMFDAKTGAAFAVKGIDYYPRPNTGEYDENNRDFFTDDFEDVWSPDIDYLAATGANAVRLYAVDPSKSHDKFMCALRAKGMYALIDFAASCLNCAITKQAYPACYPADLKTRGEMIILAFAKYDNVLAFSAGNEVNNEVAADATINAPCQKKFIRDMRAFVGNCPSIRKIPVGVVLADPDLSKNNRELNAKYYNCRTAT